MSVEERVRVRWSSRRRRPWCPGATRPVLPPSDGASSGWTSFVRWSSVLGLLRERLQRESPPPPAPALPSRRTQPEPDSEPLTSWLDETAARD